ncbi:dihydrofolate reductase family protein [Dactylosporangium darangshiense]
MRNVVAGLAISLDGVVERPSAWSRFDAEMGAMITEGLAGADAVLIGTSTYREFCEIWPGQPDSVAMAAFLNAAPKYVVTSTLTEFPWRNSSRLEGDLRGGVERLRAMPGGDILVPGSPRLVRSLLGLGLLDRLNLMIHPVVVGSGLRLFDGLAGLRLALRDVRHLRASGAVALAYGRE